MPLEMMYVGRLASSTAPSVMQRKRDCNERELMLAAISTCFNAKERNQNVKSLPHVEGISKHADGYVNLNLTKL